MKKYLLVFLFFVTQMVFAQQDCNTAIPICSDANIALTPGGTGLVDESEHATGSCLYGESNSIWLTFSVQTAGTLTFMITPNAVSIDYDWALYGPNHDCANLNTPPLRCSYAGIDYGVVNPTGLTMTATDLSEAGDGDGYIKYIDVLPGQVYHLLLNNFSTNIAPFSLTFGGTATLLTPFDHNSAQVHQPNPFIVPGPNHDGKFNICADPTMFDFSALSAGIINNNPNFIVKYYRSGTDALDDVNAITTPIPVTAANTYTYAIAYVDPNSPTSFLNKCREFGTINFIDRSFKLNTATLTACNNNNAGTALYDLTSANIGATANLTLQYYPSMYALNNNVNEITAPYAYTSAAGSAFVKATNEYGCVTVAEIKLNFHPVVTVTDATIRSCFIEANPSTASFNLAGAIITSDPGVKTYFPSLTDAINNTNAIPDTQAINYIAPNGVVYIKVTNANGCYAVAKVTLVVIPPVYSTLLKDQTICIEDTTTLDAGTGFNGYEWSTGATTQSITNVGVGTYWVRLKTGDCYTTQKVTIFPSEQPVVSNIDIANNTVTINAIGGTAPYKYSMDNVNWQDSNVFTNVPRGDNKIYVKDAFDCNPIDINIVVPNLVNVITPNGDGVNDVVDYTALGNKQNLILSVFDRYGNKIFQADKFNGYKWDGTVNGGKKVPTGTYWYSVTWNENNKLSTPIKYTGWVLVKNRD